MHRLQVDGFLGIDSADIDLNGITVIIGPQASGKSVLARLMFFGNEYFADFDVTSIANNEHKATFDTRKRKEFAQIFPPYSWEEPAFSITYTNDLHEITLSSAKGSASLDIKTSSSVATYFRRLKSDFRKFDVTDSEDTSLFISPTRRRMEFREFLRDRGDLQFEHALFVPAARSFYATIRDEIFSILALDGLVAQIA